MKRGGILNPELLDVIARAGHGDLVVVTDRGFPLSAASNVRAVDLSIAPGLPRLMEVVRPLAVDLVVEKTIIAEETISVNPEIASEIRSAFEGVPEQNIPHDEFKKTVLAGEGRNGRVVAQIRTGEWSRYGNVILVCGVAF